MGDGGHEHVLRRQQLLETLLRLLHLRQVPGDRRHVTAVVVTFVARHHRPQRTLASPSILEGDLPRPPALADGLGRQLPGEAGHHPGEAGTVLQLVLAHPQEAAGGAIGEAQPAALVEDGDQVGGGLEDAGQDGGGVGGPHLGGDVAEDAFVVTDATFVVVHRPSGVPYPHGAAVPPAQARVEVADHPGVIDGPPPLGADERVDMDVLGGPVDRQQGLHRRVAQQLRRRHVRRQDLPGGRGPVQGGGQPVEQVVELSESLRHLHRTSYRHNLYEN